MFLLNFNGMDKKIILIGGAPCAGKSFLAQKLLEKFHIPWVSTDTIREFMREVAPKDKYSVLREFDGDVEAYFKNHTAKEIFENHHKQSVAVWDGVKAWIARNYNWKQYVIEGVAIIPELVKRDFGNDPRIKPIFLMDDDSDRILDVIHTRGLWDEAGEYPESVNEKEREWVLIFNEWMKEECEKYGYPLIEVGDRSTLLERAIKYIQ